ncbi:HNH endonuclease [Clostridium senegalense]
MKKCTKCGQFKNESEFHKNSKNPDGLRNDCKKCRSKETKEYRMKYRDEVLAKKRMWYNDTKNRKEQRNIKSPLIKICTNCGIEKGINDFRQRANGGYYAMCRECENLKNKKYAKNNPDIIRRNKVISEQKRRKCSQNINKTFTHEEWKQCKRYFNNTCAYCGKKLKSLTQDHFIPLSKGGDYTKHNIIPSCRSCNCKKHDKDFYKWYETYEYYSLENIKRIEIYFKNLE